MKARLALAGLCLAAAALGFARAEPNVTLRIGKDDDVFVLDLAQSLGAFAESGIRYVPVKVEDYTPSKDDYDLPIPMHRGRVDAVVHWFQHTIYGARHRLPLTAVMAINDAPGITVMVAKRVQGQIRGPADFKGRRIAQGAGFGTKAILTGYLAARAGLPPGSYTPVMADTVGRQEAVLRGLRDGTVDVMTFETPLALVLMRSGMVSKLYDLGTRESTARVLGAPWPAQSVLVTPEFIADHPDVVQRLVNAMVRTMRFVNSHGAEEIAARLPASYFAGQDRQAAIDLIRQTLPSFARGDYSFSRAAVKLECRTIEAFPFDDSGEGAWRRDSGSVSVEPGKLYDNTFVERAMRDHPEALSGNNLR